MSFLSDNLGFEGFQLGDWWSKLKKNPEQLLLGAADPLGAKVWSGITGKKYEPFVDQMGGPYGGHTFSAFGANDGGVYGRAKEAGINTAPASTMHDAAHVVAAIYGGQGLGNAAGNLFQGPQAISPYQASVMNLPESSATLANGAEGMPGFLKTAWQKGADMGGLTGNQNMPSFLKDFWAKGNNMGGLLSGQQMPSSGLMAEPQQINPQGDMRLAMAAQLLAGSGYSPVKQSTGQVFGQALMAGQQARQAAQQMQQQQQEAAQMKQYRDAQIAKMQQPEQEPIVAVTGEDGKPKYVPRSQAIGMAPAVADNSSLPANIAEAQWYKNASPEERAIYDKQNGRDQAPYYQWVQRVLPNGATQQGTFNARTGQTSWSEEVVAPGTKPRVDAEGKALGEATGDQAAKAPVKASLNYVVDQFRPIIDKTMQGGMLGVTGMAGKVFDRSDALRFDNLREQLSTELRAIFRIPGEGTLSDREQAQYGLQLPDRGNPGEVNQAILNDILNRVQLRTETPVGGVQATPATNIDALLDKYAPSPRRGTIDRGGK